MDRELPAVGLANFQVVEALADRCCRATRAGPRYTSGDMLRLAPTPPDQLVDAAGRPYFLWDVDMTLAGFEHELATADRAGKAYLVGKMMRQAKPDDVFTFVATETIVELWPDLERYLGRTRPFWTWLLEYWGHKLERTY